MPNLLYLDPPNSTAREGHDNRHDHSEDAAFDGFTVVVEEAICHVKNKFPIDYSTSIKQLGSGHLCKNVNTTVNSKLNILIKF